MPIRVQNDLPVRGILEEENIGRRSKTKVGIVYISDIVRPGLVKHIKERIAKNGRLL